ncbi:hypothetical protein AZI86_12855 [Bdellovibrio bacteriovorus]|uniref:J domain-containing protein n=1 Tax=Bdellovibrio bacteriovorus TaxID=959 RepID=A0A150WJB0_BDEBC|nr:DnaJ domain-containing protein [Bdellovibrio bacteriovorus]KYG63713.1 hypothetical protein AZI86_12855 [Bdellovibrio bacteriovorus]
MVRNILAFLFCILFSFASLAEKNFYETLGVEKTATQEEIKKAWKALVRQYHPDRYMSDPAAAKEASAKLAVINAAESIIGDAKLRAYYNYFSYEGSQHARWSSLSGNSDVVSLEKRFGPVEKLKTQSAPKMQPSPSAKPKASPPPSASPSPRKEAPPQKPDPAQDAIFVALKDRNISDEQWKKVYQKYITEMPMEKDYERQMILVELFSQETVDWKYEALGRAIILKLDTSEKPLQIALKNFLNMQHPQLLKMGVVLLHYALAKDRTLDLFQLTRADAEAQLIAKLKTPYPHVNERAEAAVKKLKLKVTTGPSASFWIGQLENHDINIRKEALTTLKDFNDFSDHELKEISYQLLKRNAQNVQYEFTEYWMRNLMHLGHEMSDLLTILDKVKDLSPIAEELTEFRRTSTIPDHKGRAKVLEQRALNPINKCSKVFAE